MCITVCDLGCASPPAHPSTFPVRGIRVVDNDGEAAHEIAVDLLARVTRVEHVLGIVS